MIAHIKNFGDGERPIISASLKKRLQRQVDMTSNDVGTLDEMILLSAKR